MDDEVMEGVHFKISEKFLVRFFLRWTCVEYLVTDFFSTSADLLILIYVRAWNDNLDVFHIELARSNGGLIIY